MISLPWAVSDSAIGPPFDAYAMTMAGVSEWSVKSLSDARRRAVLETPLAPEAFVAALAKRIEQATFEWRPGVSASAPRLVRDGPKPSGMVSATGPPCPGWPFAGCAKRPVPALLWRTENMVRAAGIEPARAYAQRIFIPLRLSPPPVGVRGLDYPFTVPRRAEG